MRTALWLLLLLAIARIPAHAQSEMIDAYVRMRMAKDHVPGLSIAVVRDGKIVYANGFGLANVELNVAATQTTVYWLMSVSKQFTAAAVLMLAEEGKIDLNAPIARYLASAPGAWKDVLVRHLLTHTSGIPDYTDTLGWGQTIRQDRSPQDLLAPVMVKPLLFTPGTQWRYSNSNYFLLGLIIEKVSGTPWSDFLQRRIFVPLGMTSTHANDSSAIIPGRAAGYHWQNGSLQNAPYVSPSQLWAAGSIISTVEDLAKWEAGLASGKLLKRSTVEQMIAPAKLADGGETAYGYGNELGRDHGHRFAGHQGGGLAFNTMLLRYPDDRLTVIVLANLTQAPSEQIAHKIASFYLPDLSDNGKPAIADGGPQLSSRLKTVILEAAQGRADDALFTLQAQQELLPHLKRAGLRLLPPLGVMKSFTLMEKTNEGTLRHYRYRAVYAEAAISWQFTLNAEGKIADITPMPE
jgi:CubicO group peptidase (beta-lactamase class C family)